MGLGGLGGCGWGHPPRPAPAAPLPAPTTRSTYVPAGLAAEQDLAGPPPLAYARTATASDLDDALLDVLGEAEDVGVLASEAVPPILAVTGTVTFDLPMSEDERVHYWVEFLQNRGRKSFTRWLSRSTRYVPLFWEILAQYDLPKDLVFLAMIESGFSPRAYSWAHAAGPWQFMPYTGRRYGLEVGFWVDERRDFEKATHAAARYLSVLHDMFGHWWLAMAAYNAGPGKVRRAIRRTGTDDFWRLSRTYRLRRETKHYIPKLLAAARISKAPERYGFGDVEYQPPLAWEVLTVTVATDLGTLAKACGLDSGEALEDLNPELRCEVTPPGRAYPLRVPPKTAARCREGLAALNPALRMTYRYARLEEGETLAALAARHRTRPEVILAFNRIDEAQLASLGELVVPVPLYAAEEVAIVTPDPKMFRGGIYRPDGQQLIVHRVRPGDSLWRIARRYRVSLRKLRLWNGLWRTSTLSIGQRIKVFVRAGPGRSARGSGAAQKKGKSSKSHIVRSGESLWSIATEYGLTVEDLRRKNRLEVGAVLQPGQRLRID